MRAEYDREAAVAYARRWALGRNPRFGDFSALGGDCANFASQCLWAGWGDMTEGWHYRSMNERTPSWSGVRFLREWLLLDGRAQLCRADEAEAPLRFAAAQTVDPAAAQLAKGLLES